MSTDTDTGEFTSLDTLIDLIKKDNTKWWAISIKTRNGSTIALHSKDAPNRPQGIKLT